MAFHAAPTYQTKRVCARHDLVVMADHHDYESCSSWVYMHYGL